MGEHPRESARESREILVRDLNRAADGDANGWGVATVLGMGFLYLGAKLDELVQIAYRHTGLTPDEDKPRGWSADG